MHVSYSLWDCTAVGWLALFAQGLESKRASQPQPAVLEPATTLYRSPQKLRLLRILQATIAYNVLAHGQLLQARCRSRRSEHMLGSSWSAGFLAWPMHLPNLPNWFGAARDLQHPCRQGGQRLHRPTPAPLLHPPPSPVQEIFERPYFYTQLVPDTVGAEMCGTLKVSRATRQKQPPTACPYHQTTSPALWLQLLHACGPR